MQEEIWKPIADIEGYEVSSLGHVRSLKTNSPRVLKPRSLFRSPYLTVKFSVNNKPVHRTIHRLVAEAFILNPDNKPYVNHINGIKTDNRATNLEWTTPSENTRHALDKGLKAQGSACSWAKFTDGQIIYIRDNPDNLNTYELAELFGIDEANISSIQLGKTYKSSGGIIREPKCKRVPDDVRKKIKRLYVRGSRDFSFQALAKRFGIAPMTVWKIVNQ